MLACPFHVPRYQWGKTLPYMVKCNMCADRLARNELPACVETCPQKALTFGDRDSLLKEARASIRQGPRRYINHIWGEREFGGTCVMYISDVDLAALGWPAGRAAPIPSLTEPLLHKTPFFALGIVSGLAGLNWIVQRQDELASHPEEYSKHGMNRDE